MSHRLKVGDFAVVTSNLHSPRHYYAIGTTVHVIPHPDGYTGEEIHCKCIGSGLVQFVNPDDLVAINVQSECSDLHIIGAG